MVKKIGHGGIYLGVGDIYDVVKTTLALSAKVSLQTTTFYL